MIADLKNSSNEKGYSPIRTAPPPIYECNAQSFPLMHYFLLEKAFSSLAKTSKERESGGKHFNVESNHFPLGNGHVLQPESDLVMEENENGDIANLIDVSMYNGIGCPQNHLKAYHDWLACIGKGNEFKLRLFVRTLIGPALIWYAKQDTWKWFRWNDLVKDFVKQYRPSTNTTSRCSSLKRKFMESPQSFKANDPQGKAVGSILNLGKTVETHLEDKGKGVIAEELNPPPSAPKIRKSRNFTPLSEQPSIIFERLKSFGIMQPKPAKIPPPHFNSTKCCAFHSGMLGHTTDECYCLKEEIQKLLVNGRVIQRPVPPPQSMWYQLPNVIPIQNFTQVAYPQIC
ncbi:hypothetical protein A4A49_33682 [Nicotiana attenuata]|uniref:Retrotransposon gag domain-containing protein n=1 Tax=Nicotiana attenuata TaxID=49451 RepID=A0A314LF30_NICAT|nr:hypothetical protein A4A49_33682 [Nicotiana attenuata]